MEPARVASVLIVHPHAAAPDGVVTTTSVLTDGAYITCLCRLVTAVPSCRSQMCTRTFTSTPGTALVRFRASYAKYCLRRDGKTWRNRTVDSEFSDIEDARSARSAAHSRENDGLAPLMRCPPSNLHPRLLLLRVSHTRLLTVNCTVMRHA